LKSNYYNGSAAVSQTGKGRIQDSGFRIRDPGNDATKQKAAGGKQILFILTPDS
jgi:hypothetical protein